MTTSRNLKKIFKMNKKKNLLGLATSFEVQVDCSNSFTMAVFGYCFVFALIGSINASDFE